MSNCTVIYHVAGDTGADLSTVYRDENGNPIDISTMTISFTLRYEDGGEVNRPAVVDDAVNGQFHVEWQLGDIIEGEHQVEYVITDASSDVTRLPAGNPIKMVVRPQI